MKNRVKNTTICYISYTYFPHFSEIPNIFSGQKKSARRRIFFKYMLINKTKGPAHN